jgi:hypothetical protein
VFQAGHTGGQQGTSTAFLIAPDRRAGVVVLVNMDDVDAGKLAHELMTTFCCIDRQPTECWRKPFTSASVRRLESFLCRFRGNEVQDKRTESGSVVGRDWK